METQTLQQNNNAFQDKLTFTGNWFIDAGILGFVNLMEEVYGDVWKEEWKKKNPNEPDWKFNFLEYLNEKIRENEELVYYGYFRFGYLFYHAKIRFIFDKINSLKSEIFGSKNKKGIINKKTEEEQKLEEIENKLKNSKNSKEVKKLEKKKEKILQNIKRFEDELKDKNKEINKLKDEIKYEKKKLYDLFFRNAKVIIKISNEDDKKKMKEFFTDFKLKAPAIGRNFALFNSDLTKNLFGSLEYIRYLIDLDKALRNNNHEKYNEIFEKFNKFIKSKIQKRKGEGLTYEIMPDSTINPFLYSDKQFSNIGYTHMPTIQQLISQLKPPIPIYIAFLTFEYAFLPIPNRIMFYTNNLEVCYSINKNLKIKLEKAREKNKRNLIHLTWQSVLDELVERKASFSLENLYLIELNVQQNKLDFVEYIGVPKLQASILLDDHIRNALNKRVPIHKAGKNIIWKWILEEFIKGKPLYPLAFQHIRTCLTNNNLKVDYFIFYALLIDAAILEFEGKQSKSLFSDFLSQNYREVVQEIKTEFSSAFYYSTQDIPKSIGTQDERNRIAYLLLDALHGNDKARFLGILLKELNNTKNNINKSSLNWVFNKIINNNISWKEYALLLVGGLIYKNE